MVVSTRRRFLRDLSAASAISLAASQLRALESATGDSAPCPGLKEMIRQPLLTHSLYRLPVSRDYSDDGAAGANRTGYQWIEEQRQGAEWIVRGCALENPDWIAIGWRELDWGLRHQQTDGSFDSKDPFHSTSFFVEALARASILNPAGASAKRTDGLARGARWLMQPEIEARGRLGNAPFTHRRYILAAAFGQTARITGDQTFARRAAAWAQEGLSLQRPDGVNPERDGYDVSYHMVGVLMALRYLPVCDDPALRARLRSMMRKAVAIELTRLQPDGSIDPAGSTRIGKERSRSGVIKTIAYGEVAQALVYGALAVPQPEWLSPAQQIIHFKKWDRK